MLSTYLKNIAASLAVFAITLMPLMASAESGGLAFPSISNPGEGETISFNIAYAPESGVGFIIRATKDHASVHGGAWFGDRTNGVLGFGYTADYDKADWEVNGEIGMSVVFKKYELLTRKFVPYYRVGAAYLNADYRYGVGLSHYGFALNNDLEGEYVLDIEIGKDGTGKDPVVMQSDEGMTQIDPPECGYEEEICLD